MHPEAPPPTTAPEPSSDERALAHLDDVMAQAEIAANAQRDVEAGTPQAPPAGQEAQPGKAAAAATSAETPDPAPAAPEEDEEEESEGEDEDEAEETPTPEPQPATPEAPKYSRRDAVRFAAELEETKRHLEEARTSATRHESAIAAHRESDQRVLNQLSEVSGYVREGNGRFRYENLRDKVLTGQATAEEHQEVTEMTQWHTWAGPIYRAAEEQVASAFARDWKQLQDLPGVGADGLSKINKAPDGVAATRELHGLAFAAGEAKAKADADATIARLKAENKSLKTQRVAQAPQPAVPNGVGVPSSGGFLQRAIDPNTGLTTDEFDAEVRAGKWLGRDLAAS